MHSATRDLAAELVRFYGLLRAHGINDSNSGNGSVRDGGRMLITPRGACADTLTPEGIVACDLERPCDGASSDQALHRAVYAARPQARAVLHGHGAHVVALSLDGADLEPVDLEGQLYFPRVPVIDIPYDEYFERSPRAVAGALATHRIAVVRGHGMYAWGHDLEEAYKWLCSLDLSARILYLARTAGTFPGA